MPSLTDFFSIHAPFNQMLASDQEYLASHLKSTTYKAGEVITRPEEGNARQYFIIHHGRVRGESAANETAWELDSGESFPIGALLADRPVNTVCRAVEETTCLSLQADEFHQLLQQSRDFHDFCTRRLANLLDNALRSMQMESSTSLAGDSSLNTTLGNLLSSNPISCTPGTAIKDALKLVEDSQRRSIAVVNDNNQPVGILTLRDVLSRVTLQNKDINAPISDVMTKLQYTLHPDEFAYQAALLMAEKGIGHICIVDEQQHFLGLLSERDLFSLQRVGLGNLSRGIRSSTSVSQLKQLSKQISQFADQMMAQGASVTQLTKLITTLNDLITCKIIKLCEDDNGNPGVPYTWLSFGSEGREEQTLKTDQDNGILFVVPDGMTEDDCRKQLLPLAKTINDALAEVGFPLCPGNIMASNPECCLSYSEWQARFKKWVDAASPENLLNASIFFDFRPLYGEAKMVNALFDWLSRLMAKNTLFQRFMAENALRNNPPLGLFRDFVVSRSKEHPNSIDLKLQGITPFVDAARLFALANGVNATNTIQRLELSAKKNRLNKENVSAWIEAYQYIQLLRMRNHRNQSQQGKTLSNFINPDSLNELERRILKEAFRQARKLQSKVALDYQL